MHKVIEATLSYGIPGIACLVIGILFTSYISPNSPEGIVFLTIVSTLTLLVIFKLAEWLYHVVKKSKKS